ncbi:class I SAM-dependent methyltransferase [Acinetobacter sp. ANC 3813]|uniref:class I SAM-dependent methyltransferase n=1 Tax=Acinetobacter sp. ANC 3813 TaxID=1977873 RepID=UPI000B6F73B4|nr:SAM-dependent methyltransferase [Acinetobacter sp. ANC 3813]
MNENRHKNADHFEIGIDEVPSPIDLRNPDDALQWANEVNLKRPWRYEIFDYYLQEILQHAPIGNVLELGAGPGFLAKHLLQHCPNIEYTAFDFSSAMHELSKSKLTTSELKRTEYLLGDFKQPNWTERFQQNSSQQQFDVIIMHQALHELRHKYYATAFHSAVKTLMREQTLYFVCDHIFAPDAQQNNQLYMSVEEHLKAFKTAGISDAEFIQNFKGLAVFKAQR